MKTANQLLNELVEALENLHDKHGPGYVDIIKLIEETKEYLFWNDDYEGELK